MSISITCGSCDAKYNVPENLVGKKIKCKACGNAISVVAPPTAAPVAAKPKKAVAVIADDDELDNRPTPKRAKVAAAYNDDDDRPSRKAAVPAKKKSALPLILGGLVALLLVGGVGVAAVVMSGVLGEKEIAVTTPIDNEKMRPLPSDVVEGKDDKTEVKPEEKATTTDDDKKADTTTDTPKPEEPATKKNLLPVPITPPGGKVTPKSSNPDPAKTTPDQATIDRAKAATVYIERELDNGLSSGSGWFGVEQNLIFTNAHVVGMLAPSAPKPKKLTVFVNPGTKDQRIIPHAKLEIIAVDRFADLAIIKVINEKDLPVPLNIRPSLNLRDLEPLVIIGYPNGRTVSQVFGKNSNAPKPTLSTSSFQATLNDESGNLYTTQIRGGAGPGNSGGPVIDVDGNVVCVIVRGPAGEDIQYASFMNFCVPTEFVTGLLAGRVSDVEYGQPYYKDGKVNIPVKVEVLDPYNRLKEVGIGTWIGDPSKKPRYPGNTRTGVEPSDSDYVESKLDYKWTKEKQFAEGIVTFTDLPSGRAYWTQPFYTNAIVTKYYMSGTQVKLSGPPVKLEDADLIARLKINSKRPVTLVTSRDLEESEVGKEREKSESDLLEIEIKGTELVEKSPDANDLARVRVNYEKLALKVPGDEGEKQDIIAGIPLVQRNAINQDLKLIQGFGFVRKNGEIYRTINDVRGAPDTVAFLKRFSGDAMDALQQASVPLPGRTVKPNESWSVDKPTRLTVGYQFVEPGAAGGERRPGTAGGGAPQVKTRFREYKYVETVTYKYIGTRVRLGSKEAVLEVSGELKPAPGSSGLAVGRVKGFAFIDLDTGTVLESSVKKEFSLDSSADGIKKVVTGVDKYKVTRGSASTN